MTKKIIFSLLLIATATTNGMDKKSNIQTNKKNIYSNSNMKQLTQYICVNNNYNPCTIQDDIQALYGTNKSFHDYYAQKTVKQELISLCSLHGFSTHKTAALALGCKAIYAKINRITAIACDKEKQFTDKDLKDTWYLAINSTYFNKSNQTFMKGPLSDVAINCGNLEKANILLKKIENDCKK